MKSILVTGGAGYIGSHTSYLLAQQGYQVIVLDFFLHQQTFFLSNVVVIRGDFADRNLLTHIFSTYDIHAVMHFAAFIEVGESVKYPQKFYDNNVTKTLVLLDMILQFGVRTIVFSSSCAVYGIPQYIPMDEQHPTNPMSPYGRNKLMVEFALQDYAHAYGLSSVALRYFNAAGAEPLVGLGEQHEPETHVIPLLLRAIQNDTSFMVYGTDYDTIDGTCVRDYVHVYDIAQAHVLALMYLSALDKPVSFKVNLGTGNGYSVQQLINITQQVCNKQARVVYAPRRSGDSPVLVADARYAKQLFDWQPQYVCLKEIVQSAYAWEHSKKNIKDGQGLHENV